MDKSGLEQVSTSDLVHLRKSITRELKTRKRDYQRRLKDRSAPYNYDIEQCLTANAKTLTAIPDNVRKSHPAEKRKYLKYLLKQDWSHLFNCHSSERKFYVYYHTDPRNKAFSSYKELGGVSFMPFYVGKGTGNRAYNMKRNQGHGINLKEMLDLEYTPDDIVHIVKDNLTESEALELESKLIYFFGTIYETEQKGVLLNLDIGKRPLFNCHIKIPKKTTIYTGMTPEEKKIAKAKAKQIREERAKAKLKDKGD